MPKHDDLTRWIKFVPADWRTDRQLHQCSLAARGLWIDIICLCAEHGMGSEHFGKLVNISPSGVTPLSLDDIAWEVRAKPEDIEPALKELEANGVFSRTEDGIIFSRRLVADQAKFLRQSANGKKGWVAKGDPNGPRSRSPKTGDHMGGHEQGLKTDSDKTQIRQDQDAREGKKPDLKELAFDRLAKVARIDLSKLRRNSAWVTFPIVYDGWVSAGCDPEKDIWPTVEKMILSFQASTPGKSLPNTPAYLNQTVLMARDNRLKAEANGTAKVGGRFGEHMVEGYEGKPWLLTDRVVVMLAKAWGEGRWAREFGRTPADPKCSLPPEFIKELLAIRPRGGDDVWWAPPGKPDGWV